MYVAFCQGPGTKLGLIFAEDFEEKMTFGSLDTSYFAITDNTMHAIL